MKKIPTLYVRRNYDRRHVINGLVYSGCEWVLDPASGAVATRKFDGICMMLDEGGQWWTRRTVRPRRSAPPRFVQVEESKQGTCYGWVPVEDSPYVGLVTQALNAPDAPRLPGTYELCGPRVNLNPEGFTEHHLVLHGSEQIDALDAHDVEALMVRCLNAGWEGVVWHHPDGRMAKLKVRDIDWMVERCHLGSHQELYQQEAHRHDEAGEWRVFGCCYDSDQCLITDPAHRRANHAEGVAR